MAFHDYTPADPFGWMGGTEGAEPPQEPISPDPYGWNPRWNSEYGDSAALRADPAGAGAVLPPDLPATSGTPDSSDAAPHKVK